MPEPDNWLMRRLPRQYRAQLLARCRRVPLQQGQLLCRAGTRTPVAYFPVDSFVSIRAVVEDQAPLEMGIVGREGMLGVHLMLGVSASPFEATVQGAGTAWRIDAAAFRQELLLNAPLLRALQRYLYVMLSQTTTSAACLHAHRLGARLARWLLMSHDRAQVGTFNVTHELLAYILGVRRVGVTLAANALQKQGLIRYKRGSLTIVNRGALERVACSCYAADLRTYARNMH